MDFSSDIENSLKALRGGELILYPTDTIWGIGCDATDPAAVKKIFALKQRSEKKSLIILIADKRDLLKYISQPDPHIIDFLQSLQKPTTIIYEGAIGLADNVINEDGTVAIRLVNESFCNQLIKRFRKPVVSTSANISGQSVPRFFDEIADQIVKGVDYVVRYRQDDKTPQHASAIIKWNRDGTVTVVRN